VNGEEEGGDDMTSSLTELRPPPTLPTEPPAPIRRQPSTIGYWVAAIVAVLGLTAALVWGAVGTGNALDQIDTFDRVAVPGQMTVSVTDPGTQVVYYEGPAVQARYADPTANARYATRWNPATDATIVVRHAAPAPTWQQLRLQVTGPDGRLVPVSTYRSTTRYDRTAGQLGRAVARFEAATAGQYRVSATRAIETGATLAVGGNFARDIAMTALGASVLGLVTVLAAVLVAVITHQARSRTTG
jgi:hypothetical protein